MAKRRGKRKRAKPARAPSRSPRRRGTKAIHVSEKRFSSVIENTPNVAIQGYDQEGRVLFWNRASEKLFGFSARETVGKTLDQSIHTPEEAEVFKGVLRQIAETGKAVGPAEYTFKRRNGESGVCLSTTFEIPADGGQRTFICMDVDITERKRAEESLRENEARFRQILDGALDAIVIMDYGGYIRGWNPQATAIFGWSESEVTGKELAGVLIPPEHRERHRQGLRRYLETGEGTVLNRRIELPALHKSGEVFPVELAIAVLPRGGEPSFVGFVRDITERKRAESAMRESEARYRTLVEYAPEALVVFDVDMGRFVDANQNAVKLFGMPIDELLKTGPVELSSPLTPDGRPVEEAAREYLDRALAGETPAFEWLHRDAAGRDLPCEVRLVRLPAAGRRLVRGSVLDIRERKRLEEQLRQIQKVESIGRLAGGVAHDFNNILTSILGFCDLAARGAPPDSRMRAFLDRACESAQRGARLTQQLLAFARKQVIQPQVVDLNRMLREIDDMLRRLIGEDIELQFHYDPGLSTIKVDPGQIEQVLMNLVLNARDAMPSGGRLTVETLNVALDRHYAETHAEVAAGDYVMLSVADTGSGMRPEIMSHIFEPFFTTKPVGKGTGLGLSMCYGIVKQSGGHIAVYSEPGQGTTFKIYFPRAGGSEAAKKSGMPHAAEAGRGDETVLLVEDDAMIRELAAQILEMQGYRVIAAAHGAEALNLSRAERDAIHLLVTDVVMPKMGGRELAELLKKERPGLRVLYSSGYTENAIVHHGVLEEGVSFIQKPYTPFSLAQKVRQVLDAAKA